MGVLRLRRCRFRLRARVSPPFGVRAVALTLLCFLCSRPVALDAQVVVAAAPRPVEPTSELDGDGRLFIDETAEGLLRRARELVGSEDWSAALDLYAELGGELARGGVRVRREPSEADGEGEEATPDDDAAAVDDESLADVVLAEIVTSLDGRYFQPLLVAFVRELAQLPEAARALYRRTHEAAASELLQSVPRLSGRQARQRLKLIGTQFPLTREGARAWHQLGLRELDRGRAADAAEAFQLRLLLPFETGDPERAEVLAQAAMAHALAGNERRTAFLLDEIAGRHADDVVIVGGKATSGHALAEHPLFLAQRDRLQAAAVSCEASLDVWPTALATFDRRPFRLPASEVPELGSRAEWIFGGLADPNRGARAPSVLAWKGLVVIRSREGSSPPVVAVDAASGARVWEAQVASSSGGRRAVDGSMTLVTPSVSGHKDDGDGSDSVPVVVTVDHFSSSQRDNNGRVKLTPNRLVALRVDSGKRLWDVSGEEGAHRGLPEFTFLGAPVVTSAGLGAVVVVAKQIAAVGISTAGELLWFRRLYSMDLARRGTSFVDMPMASRDGVMIVEASHGVVAALEASTGEILWASHYRSSVRGRRRGRGWRRTAPIIAEVNDRPLVVVAPQDSDYLTAFDVSTGAVLWEKEFDDRSVRVLGAQGTRLLMAAASELKVVDLTSGEDSRLPYEEELQVPQRWGVVTDDRVILPLDGGKLVVVDSSTAKVTSSITLLDERIKRRRIRRVIPHRGRWILALPETVVSLEPQSAAWTNLAESRRQAPLRKALLYRAEQNYSAALDIYYELLARTESESVRERVKKEVLSVVREAAEAGETKLLSNFLAKHRALVDEPETLYSLQLLEANLLEGDASDEASRRRVVDGLASLSRLDGVIGKSPEGLDVDIAAYASERLRDLCREDEQWSLAFDVEAEEKLHARAVSVRNDATLSHAFLRLTHLGMAAEAGAHLVQKATAAGDAEGGLELLDLLVSDVPELVDEPSVEERRAELVAQTKPEGRPASALPQVLLETAMLREAFWSDFEDGFLVASAPGSQPSAALIVISNNLLRIRDLAGEVLFESELLDYPDVAKVKLQLRSEHEEPALYHLDDQRLVLFTPAGLYCYEFRPGDSSARDDVQRQAGTAEEVARERSDARFKRLFLKWHHSYEHPLAQKNMGRRHWGGIRLQTDRNSFPECAELHGNPIVALPTGGLRQIERNSGKLMLETQIRGTTCSGIGARPHWIRICSRSPCGVTLVPRRPWLQGRREFFVPGFRSYHPEAHVFAGGLLTAFGRRGLAVYETISGRPLWRAQRTTAKILTTESGVLWASERSALRARSVRSGRVVQEVEMPERTIVVDAILDPSTESAGARRGRTLIAIGDADLNRPDGLAGAIRGNDLWLVRVGADWSKVWEKQIATGRVIYAGPPLQGIDGAFLLAYNRQEGGDKWSSVCVRVAAGDSGDAAPNVAEIVRREIRGKGRELPPRLSLLTSGVGLGNTDGFGWFEAQGAAIEDDSNEVDADAADGDSPQVEPEINGQEE